jgi:ribosomal protein S18 acetylase RimI-like enzyme
MSSHDLRYRQATKTDVPAIVGLLADDALGAQREDFRDPLPQSYYDTFDLIDQDPNQELIAVESGETLVGTMQLSFLPYLTYRGGWRMQIEAVRIAGEQRGKGLGEELFNWAIRRAQERGCHLVQLTTDKARPDALRFYERLGFRASHEGMKLHLAVD